MNTLVPVLFAPEEGEEAAGYVLRAQCCEKNGPRNRWTADEIDGLHQRGDSGGDGGAEGGALCQGVSVQRQRGGEDQDRGGQMPQPRLKVQKHPRAQSARQYAEDGGKMRAGRSGDGQREGRVTAVQRGGRQTKGQRGLQ